MIFLLILVNIDNYVIRIFNRSKLVFQLLFNLAECNTGRYQPIVFTTHGNSECIYSKSKCTDEGQVVFRNDSSSRDVACRCDYTKGYAFVTKPKNSCFCKPSEEDCSCFRARCIQLSQGYTNAQKVAYFIIASAADDERKKFIHELFLKGECGKLYFTRLVFIGKNGVGKTSLMRRLLWQKKEDVTSTQSTDGIEVEKCNISIADGKWSPCNSKMYSYIQCKVLVIRFKESKEFTNGFYLVHHCVTFSKHSHEREVVLISSTLRSRLHHNRAPVKCF
ncbi:unnamed protein product [Mytilus edulis]|uniref:Uncharacterized protein n=1 Tax=Mytilus edulis TaxID=6550 RepID=A0A8S3R1D5_MYTED|nr:unnamed protein product [Mytilus edulis]